MFNTILIWILSAGMLTAGITAILLKDLTAAAVSAGLMSLAASVIYLLLSAPDVAMTEAAIGAGLSTVIFLYAVRHTSRKEESDD